MSKQLPNGWVLATLGEVANWGSGGTPSRSNSRFFSGNIPWIKTGELGNKYIRAAEEHISEDAIENSSAKVFPKGSVGIAMYGATIGKLSIWAIDASTNQACAVAQPYSELFNEFLYYYLFSEKRHLINAGKGGAQPNISQGILKAWEIPFPPVNEQKRIVAKIEQLFSELDNGIENLKTAKAQLLVYRQAVLKHAFEGKLTAHWRKQNKDKVVNPDHLLTRIQRARGVGHLPQIDAHKTAVTNAKQGKKAAKPTAWKGALAIAPDELAKLPMLPAEWKYVRLSEIAEIGSGMSVSKSRLLKDPIKVPYLRVANVQRGHLDLSKITTMEIERDQLSRLKLKKWDVLFNEGGDRDKLGRGWIWESQIEPCITQNHVFRASPYLPSVIHAKFISHWGNTFGQNYFLDEGKQTTNLASINKGVLSNFPVPLASLEEQKEIISEIDEKLTISEQLEREVTAALERLQILKSAILVNAFSGTLAAQDPNDEPASVLLERIRGKKAETENGTNKIRRRAA